ncbi:MAG: BatD family protein [Candidatus Omnitrophota bacterium]
MRKTLFIITIIFAITASASWGQGTRFEATLERGNVSVGNPIYLYLSFYGSQNVDRPDIPSVDGLKIKYVGPTSKMSVVNGQVSQSITYTYLVIPLKKGEFEIGPFFTAFQGQMYKADAVTLSVSDTPGQVTRSGPVFASAARQEATKAPYVDDNIFLVIKIEKRRLYVNEVVPVTVKLYVSGMSLRDIEYPSYAHEGFSAGVFEEPERQREMARGARYDVLIFKRNLFGIKEGDYILGPAKVQCKMLVKKQTPRSSMFDKSIFDDDFFSSSFGYNAYPVELESEEIPVTILPFPEEGRPLDFQGAVGDFTMDVHADPPKVKVGDPITLRITISGIGNLDTVTAPRLAPTDKFKTYEPQVSKKGDKKIYEQVVIPKTDDVKEIPKVSFSFFNPYLQKYETIQKGPFPVEVMTQPEGAVKMVSMPGAEQIFYPQEKLGKDIIHIKENVGDLRQKRRFLYNSWLFWAGQVAPLALFAVFYVNHRKKERMIRDKGYARFLRAPRKARKGLIKAKAQLNKEDVLPFYDITFKTLQEYLGDRFNLPKGTVTNQVIEERLRPVEYDKGILEMLHDVFSRCEMARYASFVPGGHEEEEMLEKVKRIIDYMEKVKV